MSRKALFLDRDGVIVNWVDYLSNPSEVELKQGIVELINQARDLGYVVIEVTNQSGIGRGRFSFTDYESVQAKIAEELSSEGAKIDKIYMSPYFEPGTNEHSKIGKELRKPAPGMFHAAAKEFGIDLTQSVMVGDSATDVEAAENAGLSDIYFLMGQESEETLNRSKKEFEKLLKRDHIKVINSLSKVILK
jgi:D-glycero-D-manno-heptose 1,7-bisphosphate phosphatase